MLDSSKHAVNLHSLEPSKPTATDRCRGRPTEPTFTTTEGVNLSLIHI